MHSKRWSNHRLTAFQYRIFFGPSLDISCCSSLNRQPWDRSKMQDPLDAYQKAFACPFCKVMFSEVVKLIPDCGNFICGACYDELTESGPIKTIQMRRLQRATWKRAVGVQAAGWLFAAPDREASQWTRQEAQAATITLWPTTTSCLESSLNFQPIEETFSNKQHFLQTRFNSRV